MNGSRRDIVTQFVRPYVRNKGFFLRPTGFNDDSIKFLVCFKEFSKVFQVSFQWRFEGVSRRYQ